MSTKIGVFCPASFTDYDQLKELLDGYCATADFILTNNSGSSLVVQYATERGIASCCYPITGSRNIFESNRQIIKHSDLVVVIDNQDSKNTNKVIEQCDEAARPFKVIEVAKPDPKSSLKLIKKLCKWYDKYLESSEVAERHGTPRDLSLYLNHEKDLEELEKILEQIKQFNDQQ